MVTSEIPYCQESSISFSRAFTLNQNQEESVLLRSCVLLGCYKQALRLTVREWWESCALGARAQQRASAVEQS